MAAVPKISPCMWLSLENAAASILSRLNAIGKQSIKPNIFLFAISLLGYHMLYKFYWTLIKQVCESLSS